MELTELCCPSILRFGNAGVIREFLRPQDQKIANSWHPLDVTFVEVANFLFFLLNNDIQNPAMGS
jgi:hypothetical protein